MEKTEGVLAADASFVKGQAVITYDPQQTSPQALVQALNTQTLFRASLLAGNHFKTGTRQIALQFETPLDPERTWRIGTGLKQVQGVTDVNALDEGRVGITFDPKVTDAERIVSRVEGLGYPVLGTETLSQPEVLPGDGSGAFPYWALSGMVLFGIGVFLYRRQRQARRDLAPPDASSLGKESSS